MQSRDSASPASSHEIGTPFGLRQHHLDMKVAQTAVVREVAFLMDGWQAGENSGLGVEIAKKPGQNSQEGLEFSQTL